MARGQAGPDDAGIQELIGTLYEAAMSPSQWPSAIASIARAFGATSADFHGWNKRTRDFEFAFTYNLDHLLPEYAAHYVYINPRIDFWEAHPDQVLIYDYLHIDERGMDRDEFYDWMERESDARYCMGMRVENTASSQLVCGVQFSRGHGHVERSTIERFRALAPHLVRAVGLTRKLEGEDLKNQVLGDAIQAMNCGVILVDAGARVMLANQAAEEVLAARDGLATNGGKELRAARPKDTRKLREAIACAMRPETMAACGTRQTLLVPRPSGAPPYEVLVVPTQRRAPFPSNDAGALLLVSDPEPQGSLSPDLLREHFRLTPAEIRLCDVLLEGGDLPRVAQRLGITRSTARSRLNGVLAKTGTHRQAELTALLHKLQRDWRGR